MESVMQNVTIIGVDLAKHVFQVHGAGADGAVLFRKKLSRSQFAKFMSAQAPCRVAMEACATAHYWGRQLEAFGHSVDLIAPGYVKPFIKRQKMGWLPPSRNGIAMCQDRGV
jgi:transposase